MLRRELVAVHGLPLLPHLNSTGKLSEHLLGIFPANASIGDGYAVLQSVLALLGNLLGTCA
jgi:hypothetical protein